MTRQFPICTRITTSFRKGFWLLPIVAVLAGLLVSAQAAEHLSPPQTRSEDVIDTYPGGAKVSDPYRWLEDQTSAETRAWIEGQNNYTRSLLDPLPGRKLLEEQLARLMKVDETGVPLERNGHYFYSRRSADQDLSVIYMRQGLHGRDEVLIDPHPMSPDHTTSVNLRDISRDGTLLVYSLRQGGQDETTLRLFDVDLRKDLPDELPRARYESVSFKNDKTLLYYSRATPAGPRVYRHMIGSDPAQDIAIFGKGYGPDKIILTQTSEDGRYLIIVVLHGSAANQTEVYFQNLAKAGPIEPVVKGIAARFLGGVGSDELFLQTNWQAPNGRVIAVDLNHPSRDRWRTVVPESDTVIDDLSVAGGKLFVQYLKDAHAEVKIFTPSGRPLGDVSLPTLGTAEGVSGRWTGPEVFFAFTSFHLPRIIYHYDIGDGMQEVWAQTKVPIKADQFEVKQVWYTSKDGTKVPMFLLYTRGLKLDGSNPTLLTGYGGFNSSETPVFSARAVLWAERGGVYAVPNLRGGGEFGEKWHQAGMFGNKQNVFDDFTSAAEWLIRNGYTKPSKLAILGTSNGGLLVGAALTQRPDLFQAVVCRYPLLDMLRYQNFLVARFWVSEYGSSENPRQFKYLNAYSPYQNVKRATKYPAVLLVSGDGDTRVDPLHARKMTALMQGATGSGRPVLLLYDTKSGHSGGRPLGKQIEELADELTFMFWQLGFK